MKGLEIRLAKIQQNLEKRDRYKLLEDMTDDELAGVITGDPDTKASDLSVEFLKALVKGEKP